MSYCRFSEADAYIYWSCALGNPSDERYVPKHVECQVCSLMPVRDNGWHESFYAFTFTAMLDHVAAHRAAGHDIPAEVDEELRADRDEYADDPTRDTA